MYCHGALHFCVVSFTAGDEAEADAPVAANPTSDEHDVESEHLLDGGTDAASMSFVRLKVNRMDLGFRPRSVS